MHTSDRLVLPSLPWPALAPVHCLRCGQPGLRDAAIAGEERHRPTCSRCGAAFYYNVKAVVGTLPVVDGRVLLIRRGIPPRYGTWSYPGGYLELGETVEEGAQRETREETGLDVTLDHCLGVYSRPEAGVVVVLYVATVIGGAARLCEEVLEIGYFAPADIPWEDLSFQTTMWGIRDWIRHGSG